MRGSLPPGLMWVGLALVYLLLPPAWAYLWRGLGRRRGLSTAPQPSPALRIVGRTVYSLGLPYAALLVGIADARRLGLAGFPLWPQLFTGGLAALVGALYLLWSWGRLAAATYRRSGHRRLLAATWQSLRAPWGWTYLLFDVVCFEMRWVFVRGGAVWLLGLYPGVFVALALEAGAWLIGPEGIAALDDPGRRAQGLLVAQTAVLSALVFLVSENLWLCLLAHGLGVAGAALAAGKAWARS